MKLGSRAWLAGALLVILSSCGGDASVEDGALTDTTATEEAAADEAATEEPVDQDSDEDTVTPPIGGELVALATDDAFTGANDEAGMEQAAAAFNETGFDFSPDTLATSIPDSCDAIDAATVGEIFGIGLMVDPEGYPLQTGDGYLSCTLLSTDEPDLAMMYVHFAHDLNGDAGLGEGWGAVGTMEGAFDLDLGDGALWSDGSRGDNLTNMTMLQLLVTQGGTQSYIQLQRNEPHLELIGSWEAPKMILALAAVNDSLS